MSEKVLEKVLAFDVKKSKNEEDSWHIADEAIITTLKAP
jgi:hypothetical protein